MQLKFAGLTDVGRTRHNNEDNFFVSEVEPLCVVADGMGGHNSGEVASSFAIQAVREYYDLTREGNDSPVSLPDALLARRDGEMHRQERRLLEAMLYANQSVHQQATDNPELEGMGTTVVGGFFMAKGVFLAHVGDSRAYRLREGRLQRMTRDHSLADEYLAAGLLSKEDVDHFPYKNVVTRALGLQPMVEPESAFLTLKPGDTLLFCSDGLTDPLSDAAILGILLKFGDDLEGAAKALVDAANEAGGPDNITAVLAHAS